MDLDQISLEVHEYKLDLEILLLFHNKTIGSSFFSNFLPIACTCMGFVDIVTKNKAIYKQTAQEEEAKI